MRDERCRQCGDANAWHCTECRACPHNGHKMDCSLGRGQKRRAAHDPKTCSTCDWRMPLTFWCNLPDCDYTVHSMGTLEWDVRTATHAPVVEDDGAAEALALHRKEDH